MTLSLCLSFFSLLNSIHSIFHTNSLESCCYFRLRAANLSVCHPFHTQNNLSLTIRTKFFFGELSHGMFDFTFPSNFIPISHTVHGTGPNERKCHCKAENFVRLNLETRQSRLVRYVPTTTTKTTTTIEHSFSFELSLAHSHVCWSVSLMLCSLYRLYVTNLK